MTCIAIIKNKKGKIVMAGDRRVSYDSGEFYQQPEPKIKKCEVTGILLGASGDSNLCELLMNMTLPDVTTDKTHLYMQYDFKKALRKHLIQNDYTDQHKVLNIPNKEECEALLVIYGKGYIVNIYNPNSDDFPNSAGIIAVEPSPIPFAIGSGSSSAIPILLAEHKRDGYMKKDHLALAMQIASETISSVDNQIDYVSEN